MWTNPITSRTRKNKISTSPALFLHFLPPIVHPYHHPATLEVHLPLGWQIVVSRPQERVASKTRLKTVPRKKQKTLFKKNSRFQEWRMEPQSICHSSRCRLCSSRLCIISPPLFPCLHTALSYPSNYDNEVVKLY